MIRNYRTILYITVQENECYCTCFAKDVCNLLYCPRLNALLTTFISPIPLYLLRGKPLSNMLPIATTSLITTNPVRQPLRFAKFARKLHVHLNSSSPGPSDRGTALVDVAPHACRRPRFQKWCVSMF